MRRGSRYDPVALRRWARCTPQPEIEQRVLAAVILEAELRAIATDLEISDFTHFPHQAVFTGLRNLEAAGDEISGRAIAQHLAVKHAEKPPDVPEMYFKFLVLVCEVLLVRSYEFTFGPAARGVFEADLRLLRLIRLAIEEQIRGC